MSLRFPFRSFFGAAFPVSGGPLSPAPGSKSPSYLEQPEILQGRVEVVSGDTVSLGNRHVRLFGISAPDLEDPWGQTAKWALVSFCKSKTVHVELDRGRRSGRDVGRCYLPDGTDLSAAMVEAGLALDWSRYSGGLYGRFEPAGARERLWRVHEQQVELRYHRPVQVVWSTSGQ